ncbi:transposase [Pleurocapsales cyanobacterium LEGE 10410]|nr:transposase [Pleurocapsales cyanobacterium LEGE 10410]
MNQNSRLYNALNQWMSQPADWSHLCHLKTCVWMIVALIHAGDVNLTKWSIYIPCRGQFAQSRQRRIQRWLNNPRINVHRIYSSLVKAALADWSEASIFLALDTSLFWDEYCLVRLSVIHRGRALPIVWRVMQHESASISFTDYQELLGQAQTRLPKDTKVVVLADRGFVHTELMKMLTDQLRWHYRIRIKSNNWIWRGNWCQPKNLHLNRGEAICLHNVRIHKGEFYGIVHVIIGRNNLNGELWAIVSDEKTTLQTFAEYGLRFDIEENFLDDQSGGWNVQRSMIRDVCALSRLWFILAVATLYVSAQGTSVVDSGKRRWVDTHWFRGNSYFRIGWDWVKAALVNGWKLICSVTFSGYQDPTPAIASLKQHQQRLFQLEFQVQTYSYNIS